MRDRRRADDSGRRRGQQSRAPRRGHSPGCRGETFSGPSAQRRAAAL